MESWAPDTQCHGTLAGRVWLLLSGPNLVCRHCGLGAPFPLSLHAPACPCLCHILGQWLPTFFLAAQVPCLFVLCPETLWRVRQAGGGAVRGVPAPPPFCPWGLAASGPFIHAASFLWLRARSPACSVSSTILCGSRCRATPHGTPE